MGHSLATVDEMALKKCGEPEAAGENVSAHQFVNVGQISFSPEPTATACVPRFIAVAVGSRFNKRERIGPGENVAGVDRRCRVLYSHCVAALAGRGSARSATKLRGDHEPLFFFPVCPVPSD
jgi:hypothetical protein